MNRREFFDRHAEGWDGGAARDQEASLRRVVAEARLARGQRVLDVGTGTGVLLPFILAEIGSKGRALAVEISRKMLGEVQAKRFPSNVTLVQADAQHLCVGDGVFDRAICNAAFPHFEDRGLGLREMVRALRPGGLLVISHPIGRVAVNARHREAGGPVEEDRVPSPLEMISLLDGVGLLEVVVVDEPEFYLARGWKKP